MVEPTKPAATQPPEFGPNGVVLNAPGMTDEMRAELENEKRAQNRVTMNHARDIFVFALVFAALRSLDPKEWLESRGISFWWFGAAFFGALLAIYLYRFSRNDRKP